MGMEKPPAPLGDEYTVVEFAVTHNKLWNISSFMLTITKLVLKSLFT